MSIYLKDPKYIEDDLVRMLAGFSQMHLPSVMDELSRWHPPVDVMEIGDKLIIVAEIAGISAESVMVNQKEDMIVIQGTRSEVSANSSPVFHHMEINYGPYERNIKIPKRFVGGEIKALYRNGFLRLEIAGKEPREKIIELT